MQFVYAMAAASYLLNENLIQFPTLSGTQRASFSTAEARTFPPIHHAI